ncbi:MAG: TolC family protein, partial [Kofleriaceae bacterium]
MLIVVVPACASRAGMREHDAMIATLGRIDRNRSVQLVDEVALGATALDRAQLVAAVLARNPDLDAARATWRAAVAAYPSAVTIDDPRLTYEVAPFSIGSTVPFGQRVELSQKLPYPGKRAAAGDAAIASADAAEADYGTLRLELAEAAVHAFDDDYVAARALEVNTHHHELIERIYKSATAQYT